jgi:hypothetical protein
VSDLNEDVEISTEVIKDLLCLADADIRVAVCEAILAYERSEAKEREVYCHAWGAGRHGLAERRTFWYTGALR